MESEFYIISKIDYHLYQWLTVKTEEGSIQKEKKSPEYLIYQITKY